MQVRLCLGFLRRLGVKVRRPKPGTYLIRHPCGMEWVERTPAACKKRLWAILSALAL